MDAKRMDTEGRTRKDRRSTVLKFASPVAFLLFVAACSVPGAAQDTVYVSSSTSTRGYTKLTGRVVEYTGRELRFEIAGATERTIPPDQVLRIETQYGRSQVEADAAFADGESATAVALYGQARREETRPWVRRQITARMVWCYRALDRPELAVEEFRVLIGGDPQTPYFACIPLAWVPSQPSVVLERAARQWLVQEETPALVLLGASHLMSTSARPAALARLKQLALGSDDRMTRLAQAQTWRAAVVTADARQLAGWEAAIEAMPEPLRAGPYYVLGLGWGQRQEWEQAARALLRIPILYPQHRLMAARSLLDAGRSLEKLDRPRQAAGLYRELMKTHPQTRAATEARTRLEELAGRGNDD